MPANFQNAAVFYDALARLVYGSAQIDAQRWLLQYLKSGDNVLIVGGGTGAILEAIANVLPAGLQITYVEIAPQMMQLSRKRKVGENKVTYINKGIEEVITGQFYNAVITPFFFDNFTDAAMQQHMAYISSMLKPGGLWLNSSFQLSGRWWQPLLLRAMFVFFKLVCGLEATHLPDIGPCFSRHGYGTIAQKEFYKEFIVSAAMEKRAD